MIKKVLIIALLLIISITCSREDDVLTLLEITISENPVGGQYINRLILKMNGKITGKERMINVKVEWWGVNTTGTQLLSTRDHYFSSKYNTSEYSILNAPSGYVFYGTIWARIHWKDDDNEHFLESNKVICYIK